MPALPAPLRLPAKAWHKLRPHLIGRTAHARKLGVRIGRDCRIYIEEWGSEPFLIALGDDVTVTDGVRFLTHDGSTCLFTDERGARYQRFGRITVGDRVFIGVGTIILPGISIGSDCVIGAGSVVTRDIAPGLVVAGNPARVLGNTASLGRNVAKLCASDSLLDGCRTYPARVNKAMAIQHRRESVR